MILYERKRFVVVDAHKVVTGSNDVTLPKVLFYFRHSNFQVTVTVVGSIENVLLARGRSEIKLDQHLLLSASV